MALLYYTRSSYSLRNHLTVHYSGLVPKSPTSESPDGQADDRLNHLDDASILACRTQRMAISPSSAASIPYPGSNSADGFSKHLPPRSPVSVNHHTVLPTNSSRVLAGIPAQSSAIALPHTGAFAGTSSCHAFFEIHGSCRNPLNRISDALSLHSMASIPASSIPCGTRPALGTRM